MKMDPRNLNDDPRTFHETISPRPLEALARLSDMRSAPATARTKGTDYLSRFHSYETAKAELDSRQRSVALSRELPLPNERRDAPKALDARELELLEERTAWLLKVMLEREKLERLRDRDERMD